jgi:16S rRNA (cytosine967-C5)-methyltransferase
MKIAHQIRAFEQILESYDGILPLHRYLLSYFKRNKKMGSSDRRWASRYIYSFFRLGNALSNEEPVTRLAVADFLCNTTGSLVIDTYLPQFKEQANLPVKAKLTLIMDLYPAFKIEEIFPFSPDLLSDTIDRDAFFTSFLTQPDLFIRVQKNHALKMLNTLRDAGVLVHDLSEKTFAMPNGTKLEAILPDQKYYQVQDLSSQKTGAYFQPQKYEYWWDCCAASGGKSLLLHDLEPSIQLLVSDVRETSLNNLDERFQLAGLKKYQKKVLDLLLNNEQELHHYTFDGIILDAPCSGSGTWGRTPEMLHYFDAQKISFFQNLQKTIAANVLAYLKPGKPLVYITCSVFKQENEEVIAYLQEEHHLKLESMEAIKGYQDKADTMFVARLLKA